MKKIIFVVLVVCLVLGGGISAFFMVRNNNVAKETCECHNYCYFKTKHKNEYNYKCSECGDIQFVKIDFSEGSGDVVCEDKKISVKLNDTTAIVELSGAFFGEICFNSDIQTKLNLCLNGVEIESEGLAPLVFKGESSVGVTLKSGKTNIIKDGRPQTLVENDYSSTIYCSGNLNFDGNGKLIVSSINHNGIHAKSVASFSCDSIESNKNIEVQTAGYAVKGESGIDIHKGKFEFVSQGDDGLKTTSAEVLPIDNQKGCVNISGGDISIYSAYDGIDSSLGVNISGAETKLNIFTNTRSRYTSLNSCFRPQENLYMIMTKTTDYTFSIKYYFSDGTFEWHSSNGYFEVQDGVDSYYYFKIQRPLKSFETMEVFSYKNTSQGQELNFVNKTMKLCERNAQDTIIWDIPDKKIDGWTVYRDSLLVGEKGLGIDDGNIFKAPKSAKGIKANGFLTIKDAFVCVDSYDDALHLNESTLNLQNEVNNLIKITNSNVTLFSYDDAIHSDGNLKLIGSEINIIDSYEGIEGKIVEIDGGNIRVVSRDDAINGTKESGDAVVIKDGNIYLLCGGDGLDSNGTMLLSGGNVVVFSTSIDESCIDIEQNIVVTGDARVVGIGRSNCLYWFHIEYCVDFENKATFTRTVGELNKDEFLLVKIGGETICCVKSPVDREVGVVYFGSSGATFDIIEIDNHELDENGVWWKASD